MQIANRTHGRRRHTERISITVSGKHHQQDIELQCSVTDRRDGGQGGDEGTGRVLQCSVTDRRDGGQGGGGGYW